MSRSPDGEPGSRLARGPSGRMFGVSRACDHPVDRAMLGPGLPKRSCRRPSVSDPSPSERRPAAGAANIREPPSLSGPVTFPSRCSRSAVGRRVCGLLVSGVLASAPRGTILTGSPSHTARSAPSPASRAARTAGDESRRPRARERQAVAGAVTNPAAAVAARATTRERRGPGARRPVAAPRGIIPVPAAAPSPPRPRAPGARATATPPRRRPPPGRPGNRHVIDIGAGGRSADSLSPPARGRRRAAAPTQRAVVQASPAPTVATLSKAQLAAVPAARIGGSSAPGRSVVGRRRASAGQGPRPWL
jgi:hypothetical protein